MQDCLIENWDPRELIESVRKEIPGKLSEGLSERIS